MARFLSTYDRFNKNLTTSPFAQDGTRPLPTRNLYALFNDGGHDLFRHGLSEVSPASIDGGTGIPLSQFTNTVDYSPFGPDTGNRAAKEDPVMFGFDLIIRSQESPLFSDVIDESVSKFFESNVVPSEEMMSRIEIWQDFKETFFQFFRSSYNTQPLGQSANPDNPLNSRFYYYLTKVTGLDGLVEANTMETANSFVDYGKDMIKLDFTEDVTLRIGRMAALYKSLYWSRMSGKTMIPENLLRFDCDIIVSEVRNFVKLKNVLQGGTDRLVEADLNNDGLDDKIFLKSGGLNILRDNVNRYVYTLYDCQLFFDKMPHGDVIDLATQPAAYEGYSIGFTYKHSTMRVDVFNPYTNSYGVLNNGSYKPRSVTPFDKFLNLTVPISSTSSTISETTIAAEIPVIIDVVDYSYGRSIELTPPPPPPPAPIKTSDEMGTDSDGVPKTKTSASGAEDDEPAGPPERRSNINSVKLAGQTIPDLSRNPIFDASGKFERSVSYLKYKLNLDEVDNYTEGKRLSTINSEKIFGSSGPLRVTGFVEPNTVRTVFIKDEETLEIREKTIGSTFTNAFEVVGKAMIKKEVDKYKEGKRLATIRNGKGERILDFEGPEFAPVFKDIADYRKEYEVDKYKEGKRLATRSENGERILGFEGPEYPNKFKETNEGVSLEERTKIFEAKANSVPTSFKQENDKMSKSELDGTKSGAPKESWLNSDSPGARFAKRIVNTGIAAANQFIAKRTALLTKTLNTMANEAGYSSMLPPKNIYESDFNGELYLSSKLVRDSFENFVGESISNLFNKGNRPL